MLESSQLTLMRNTAATSIAAAVERVGASGARSGSRLGIDSHGAQSSNLNIPSLFIRVIGCNSSWDGLHIDKEANYHKAFLSHNLAEISVHCCDHIILSRSRVSRLSADFNLNIHECLTARHIIKMSHIGAGTSMQCK